MNDSDTGLRLLAIVLGFWIIMRSVNKDASGATLIDHILGQSGGANQNLPGSITPTGTAATGASAGVPAGGGPTYLGNAGTGARGLQALLPDMRKIAAEHHWNAAQIQDWLGVEEHEDATGSLTAKNPNSDAYGEAQFINGPSEYAQYGGNANTMLGQLTAMANYIEGRYGNPAAALQHEDTSHWY